MDEVVLLQLSSMCGALRKEAMEKEALAGAGLLSGARRLLAPVGARAAEAVGKGVASIKGAPRFGADWLAQGGRAERLYGRLATTGLGAASGATYGAATGEEGSRARRAVGGALLGGGAGLLAGQLATGAGRRQLERATQRQAHALTGIVPQRSVTGFSAPGTAAGAVAAAPAKAYKAMTDPEKLEALGRLGIDVSSPVAQRASLTGLTNIPGFVKGLATHPIQTLKTGTLAGGRLGAGIMAAFTLPQIPHALHRTRESGSAENVGQLLGETVGYVAGSPIPVAGNIAAGSLLGHAGRYLGRGFSALTGVGGRAPKGRLQEGM